VGKSIEEKIKALLARDEKPVATVGAAGQMKEATTDVAQPLLLSPYPQVEERFFDWLVSGSRPSTPESEDEEA
jgi:hypothetical protein